MRRPQSFCYNSRMDDPELVHLIVNRLSKSANMNDLLMEICETHRLPWSEAEALVLRVQAEQEHAIAGRQFPLLFVIALGIFFIGLALVVYDSYVFISLLKTYLSTGFTNLGTLTNFRLIFESGYMSITGIIIGAAMMLGSLVGMRRAWTPLLDHLMEKR